MSLLPSHRNDVKDNLSRLPVTVCSADDVSINAIDRPRTSVVNTENCKSKWKSLGCFSFPASGPSKLFDSLTISGNITTLLFRNVLIVNEQQDCVVSIN